MSKKKSAEPGAGKGSGSYHHGDLRNALIKAGIQVLAERGKEGLSLRAAAARAGVSPGAPYRHFSGKEALLAAMAEEGFRSLERKMAAAAQRHPRNPGKRLILTAEAYLRLAESRPDFFRIMFGSYRDLETEAAGVYSICEKVFADLAWNFKDRVFDRRSGKWDAEQSALSFWAFLHGSAMLLIDGKLGGFGPPGESPRVYLMVLVSRYVRGLIGRG